MVFGESMFAHRRDASKIALSALVALCRAQGLDAIDCQQNTAHLCSLGATSISRTTFAQMVAQRASQAPAKWQFDPLYWLEIL
jgi:leucyl/phenylalanyl-tRNA--protein transferase